MHNKISNKQYAVAFYEAAKDLKGERLHTALKKFVLVLARNHKLKKAEKIIGEFVKYAKKQAGILEMNVSSARKLEKHTLDLIDKAFSAKGGPVSGGGGKTEMTEDIDSGLIGGVKIKTDDKVFDGSVKKQLQKLKQALI